MAEIEVALHYPPMPKVTIPFKLPLSEYRRIGAENKAARGVLERLPVVVRQGPFQGYPPYLINRSIVDQGSKLPHELGKTCRSTNLGRSGFLQDIRYIMAPTCLVLWR